MFILENKHVLRDEHNKQLDCTEKHISMKDRRKILCHDWFLDCNSDFQLFRGKKRAHRKEIV